jgi:hypothetical protein
MRPYGMGSCSLPAGTQGKAATLVVLRTVQGAIPRHDGSCKGLITEAVLGGLCVTREMVTLSESLNIK